MDLNDKIFLQEEAITAIIDVLTGQMFIDYFTVDKTGKRAISVQLLEIFLDWQGRYFSAFGPLPDFLESNKLFRLITDNDESTSSVCGLLTRQRTLPEDSTDGVEELRSQSVTFSEEGEGTILTTAVKPTPSDLTSATSSDYQAASDEAALYLKDILSKQSASNPPFHMKLSQLCLMTNSRWSADFQPKLNSFTIKKWLTEYNATHSDSPFIIIGGAPGKDVIGLSILNPRPIQTTILDHGERGGGIGGYSGAPGKDVIGLSILNPRPIQKTILDHGERGGGIGGYTDAIDQRTGVSVSDYYHLSLLNDPTERAYQRKMGGVHSTIARLVNTGILNDSLSYEVGRFDTLEWFGDAVLHLELSKVLMESRSCLFGVDGMTPQRINAEQRLTLALIFDELHLARFVRRCPPHWNSELWKCKGDFVEAVIGELADRLNDASSNGVPTGHPERETILMLLKTFAQAALHRGSSMKDKEDRDQLTKLARRPGGGGFKITSDDVDASLRCPR